MADTINFDFVITNYTPSYPIVFNFGADAPVIHAILAGTSSNFTSVWADSNANINTARIYVSSAGTGAAFSVVSLVDHSLHDYYSLTASGYNNEALVGEDIVDINVNTSPGA